MGPLASRSILGKEMIVSSCVMTEPVRLAAGLSVHLAESLSMSFNHDWTLATTISEASHDPVCQRWARQYPPLAHPIAQRRRGLARPGCT